MKKRGRVSELLGVPKEYIKAVKHFYKRPISKETIDKYNAAELQKCLPTVKPIEVLIGLDVLFPDWKTKKGVDLESFGNRRVTRQDGSHYMVPKYHTDGHIPVPRNSVWAQLVDPRHFKRRKRREESGTAPPTQNVAPLITPNPTIPPTDSVPKYIAKPKVIPIPTAVKNEELDKTLAFLYDLKESIADNQDKVSQDQLDKIEKLIASLTNTMNLNDQTALNRINAIHDKISNLNFPAIHQSVVDPNEWQDMKTKMETLIGRFAVNQDTLKTIALRLKPGGDLDMMLKRLEENQKDFKNTLDPQQAMLTKVLEQMALLRKDFNNSNTAQKTISELKRRIRELETTIAKLETTIQELQANQPIPEQQINEPMVPEPELLPDEAMNQEPEPKLADINVVDQTLAGQTIADLNGQLQALTQRGKELEANVKILTDAMVGISDLVGQPSIPATNNPLQFVLTIAQSVQNMVNKLNEATQQINQLNVQLAQLSNLARQLENEKANLQQQLQLSQEEIANKQRVFDVTIGYFNQKGAEWKSILGDLEHKLITVQEKNRTIQNQLNKTSSASVEELEKIKKLFEQTLQGENFGGDLATQTQVESFLEFMASIHEVTGNAEGDETLVGHVADPTLKAFLIDNIPEELHMSIYLFPRDLPRTQVRVSQLMRIIDGTFKTLIDALNIGTQTPSENPSKYYIARHLLLQTTAYVSLDYLKYFQFPINQLQQLIARFTQDTVRTLGSLEVLQVRLNQEYKVRLDEPYTDWITQAKNIFPQPYAINRVSMAVYFALRNMILKTLSNASGADLSTPWNIIVESDYLKAFLSSKAREILYNSIPTVEQMFLGAFWGGYASGWRQK